MHVIVGSGPIGSTTATLLASAGEHVRVVTRSGTGPRGAELVAADASDARRMRELTAGATVLYNCANPPYDRWPIDWPPIADSLLAAAEANDAVLVTVSNLYGYGRVSAPITEDTPLAATGPKGRTRAAMWHQALAAHRAGRVRATEARPSDFIGPGSGGLFEKYLQPAIAAGRTVRPPVPVDVPRTFTYTGDVAELLVVLGRDERAWGRPWHVPSPPPITLREMSERYAAHVGVRSPKIRPIPGFMVRAAARFDPLVREFLEVRHSFLSPWIVDASRATATFGLHPTALVTALGVPRPAADRRSPQGSTATASPAGDTSR
jgi:nucleoside-diphosphate-sugar epimerase